MNSTSSLFSSLENTNDAAGATSSRRAAAAVLTDDDVFDTDDVEEGGAALGIATSYVSLVERSESSGGAGDGGAADICEEDSGEEDAGTTTATVFLFNGVEYTSKTRLRTTICMWFAAIIAMALAVVAIALEIATTATSNGSSSWETVSIRVVKCLAFLFPLVLAPYALIQRRKIDTVPRLSRQVSDLGREVRRLHRQNRQLHVLRDKWTCELKKLRGDGGDSACDDGIFGEEDRKRMQQLRRKLDRQPRDGRRVQLERKIEEYGRIERQMQQLLEARELRSFLTSKCEELDAATTEDCTLLFRQFSQQDMERLAAHLQAFADGPVFAEDVKSALAVDGTFDTEDKQREAPTELSCSVICDLFCPSNGGAGDGKGHRSSEPPAVMGCARHVVAAGECQVTTAKALEVATDHAYTIMSDQRCDVNANAIADAAIDYERQQLQQKSRMRNRIATKADVIFANLSDRIRAAAVTFGPPEAFDNDVIANDAIGDGEEWERNHHQQQQQQQRDSNRRRSPILNFCSPANNYGINNKTAYTREDL